MHAYQIIEGDSQEKLRGEERELRTKLRTAACKGRLPKRKRPFGMFQVVTAFQACGKE
jgi:hypothetical protein